MGSGQTFVFAVGRRGFGRAAAFLAAGALLVAASGCGHDAPVAAGEGEKAGDVEVLNALLAQELTTVDAYARAAGALRGQALAVAAEFRGQDLAHVDAITKAVRGLEGETAAEAAEAEGPRPDDRQAALLSLYESENTAFAEALDAAPQVETDAPRKLAAALAASHAQHLAALRQLLGASLPASVPAPFETGDLPPPVPPAEGG